MARILPLILLVLVLLAACSRQATPPTAVPPEEPTVNGSVVGEPSLPRQDGREEGREEQRQGDEDPEGRAVLAAAAAYMGRQGLKVGSGKGEIVLALENRWDDRAIVLYGFAASEFFAELGLRWQNGTWQVTHDQARYFAYDDVSGPAEALAEAEDFVFGDEPGKYLLGVKDYAPSLAVLLVAPYGEPWAWEYVLEKRQDSWVIVSKNHAEEEWEPAR